MQAENGNQTAQEVTLKLSIDEANLVLEGLGHIPFARVYTLVNKLQAQASQQLNGTQNNAEQNKGVSTIEKEAALLKA
ncbi:MAG: hypothetical protein VST69_04510 [Nitrospirota bacterium]|nr:hypothetical protein [Nitrospirota bacterium]